VGKQGYAKENEGVF